ncbi:MAG: alpha/beta hydrolase [Acidobacteria bacterium]|nr:alpha/beta hydrolase [Acidobacteriota bacterium]
MTAPVPALRRHPRFASTVLEPERDVIVYLPPGYDADDTVRYPVLYLHDGQNLFEPDTAHVAGQHWRLGETADALIAEGVLAPLIMVGVANTGTSRIHEYTPTSDARLGGGRADAYGRLLIDELKPLIDATYRTRPGPVDTGIGGSSLGGLVSLHLALSRPDVFGMAAVMSPSVWWDRRVILTTVRRTRPRPALRLWVDMGTAEGHRALDDARLLKAALVGAGWRVGVDLHYAEYEGGTHSETAWAARSGAMLQWMMAGVTR